MRRVMGLSIGIGRVGGGRESVSGLTWTTTNDVVQRMERGQP